MKRGILYSSLLALVVLFGVAVFSSPDGSEKIYQPRNAQGSEEGIHGAMEWLHMLRANPATGEVPVADVLAARAQDNQMMAKRKKSALNLQWESIGPNNVGGRTRSFLIDKDNPNILYAGSVGGGLFKSVNGGSSWSMVSDPGADQSVCSVAQAPDGTIYYGTGESMYTGGNGRGSTSTPGFIGGGIYKSTDGGNTFTLLPSTDPSVNSAFQAVGKLEVDPNNSNRIYAGTSSGLRLSTDGGNTWVNPVSGIGSNESARDMVVTPSGKVWVKSGAVIYFSNTGDDGSFTEITSNNGIPRNTERMRIAVSPQDENYVYVVSIQNREFGKAYQSTDGGVNWRVIGEKTAFLNPHSDQGNYDNALTVSPFNKERIIVGGVQLWEWSEQNGWQQLASSFAPEFSPIYVHADNHNVVWSKTDPNKFYVTNDGGVFRTTDSGLTFNSLNGNYSTMQFFHISLGPEGTVMGGAQDNGTVLLDPNSSIPNRGVDVFGGDGGVSQMSRLHPGVFFAESQHGNTARSADFGQSFENYLDQSRMDPGNLQGTSQFSNWIMPYVLWEKLNDPNSQDSIRFGADSIVVNLGFGGGAKTFTGTFTKPQPATIFIPEGFKITAGSQVLTSIANGNVVNATGDSIGFFDPVTGDFEATFTNPVILEVVARAAVRYDAGAVINLTSAINDLPITFTLANALSPAQRVFVQDPVQATMFMGLRSHSKAGLNNTGGIWMTREILSNLEGIPQWLHIGNLTDGEAPVSMAVSNDGDILFVGTDIGRVYRFSNLLNARDSANTDIDHRYVSNVLQDSSTSIVEKRIMSIFPNTNGRVITGIAVHPYNKNKVLVSVGNYGKSDYVYYNDQAAAANPPAFKSVQGIGLPEMPVYSVTFNFAGPGQVLVGSERGIYTTDDISAGIVSWNKEINGFSSVPVFSLQQDLTVRYDLRDTNDFEGAIYAGSHGLGVYLTRSTANYVTVGMEERKVEEEAADLNVLNVYPNPAPDFIRVELKLESPSDVEISIHNINGKLVKNVKYTRLARNTEFVEVRVGSLAKGSYVIHMVSKGKAKSGKFIKN